MFWFIRWQHEFYPLSLLDSSSVLRPPYPISISLWLFCPMNFVSPGPENDAEDCGLPILCIFYIVIFIILLVTIYTTIKGSKDWLMVQDNRKLKSFQTRTGYNGFDVIFWRISFVICIRKFAYRRNIIYIYTLIIWSKENEVKYLHCCL